ncbi:MAG: calcineurin-like phosphoesterase C-terminal domain-containing protein [Alistipes sp.]|nr:calcineurin-like phosphoesterase C-terminal domain-containing protein [Alistipes sp.]
MKRALNLLTLLLLVATTVSAQSTFTSSAKVSPKRGATIYGVVECDGVPLEGVAVSDGYQIVHTSKKGVYQLPSAKRNGNVFIIIPSGYEALTEGDDVVPQFWAHLTADAATPERHDFTLRKVDNDRHVIVAVTDIHLSNRFNDFELFAGSFVPSLRAELEQYRQQGIPVYTISMGDNSFDLYWYDYLYDIGDFRTSLIKAKYPTPFFNAMGNHDHDGATPCSEQTDFLAAAKYRKAFGPTYYSFNIGKIHYVILDNIVYHNEPSKNAKKGKGIVGSRNHSQALTREQLDWLAKDLALVDKSTPVIFGVHSPIFRYKNYMDGEIDIRLPEEQRSEFINLIKDFKCVHILSGHTHRNRCCYGHRDQTKPDIANVTEHTVVAASGARWHTSAFGGPQIGVTGDPSGCKILPIDGTDIKWYFKATEFDSSKQFRSYDMNEVRRYFNENGEVRVFLDHFPKRTDYGKYEKENGVLIHVWDWATDWKISVKENGKELAVKRKKAECPQYMITYDIPKRLWTFDLNTGSSVKRSMHPHMFHAVASSADSTLEISVTDSFGNVYTEQMERPKAFHKHMK